MHIPVLLDACLEGLITNPSGVYVDGTLGNGGHASAILDRLSPDGRLIGFDRDIDAIERVKPLLSDKRVELIHDNYAQMANHINKLGIKKVDGILLDLGVSSNQLDTPERGFSFMQDGPLDMRMNQTTGQTAEELVNEYEEKELADIMYRFGEENASRRIARTIIEKRKQERITSTLQLANLVEQAKGGRRGKRKHPATQTFQAIRMAVNEELMSLENTLESMLNRVSVGGRFVILTFHSLEDRLVKQFFKRHVPREESLMQGGVRIHVEEPAVKWVWKRPRMATEKERADNPRSRSAKLRAVEIGGL